MYEYVSCGWQPYYMNFMFDALQGTLPAIVAQMHRAIEKGFYGQFCTRFTRNPTAESQHRKLPRLWLFPDLPGWKRRKVSLQELTINAGGLHFNGPMLIPWWSRFKECPIRHIGDNHDRYARRGSAESMSSEFTILPELPTIQRKPLNGTALIHNTPLFCRRPQLKFVSGQ